MGNKLSTPEVVYKHSKAGDYISLKAFLDDLERTDVNYNRNPSAILDSINPVDLNTPLIAAASKGQFQICELLLQRGANVNLQSPRPDGGSALHEAVNKKHQHLIELLLAAGAAPFVENAKGFTALDLSCQTKNLTLLRLLETHAPFSGWLVMKVPRLAGLGSEWARRYVVVVQRYPCPNARDPSPRVHTVLLCFKSTDTCTPCSRAWLDGARAQEELNNTNANNRVLGRHPAQISVILHHKHTAPKDAFVTTATIENHNQAFVIHFRPDECTNAGVAVAKEFMDLVNNRGGVAPANTTTAAATSGDARYSPLGTNLPSSAITAGNIYSPRRRSSDEELARRLQEQADAEFAAQLSRQPPSSNYSRPQSQGNNNNNNNEYHPARPPMSAPSQDVGLLYPTSSSSETALAATGGQADGFYPRVEYDNNRPLRNNNNNNNMHSFGDMTASTGPSAPTLSALNIGAGSSTRAGRPSSGSVATTSGGDIGLAVNEDAVCVVCMDNPREVGFLHGDRVHRCCCVECGESIMQSARKLCPMCREPIDMVVKVF